MPHISRVKLLTLVAFGAGALSAVQLGVNYSEWLNAPSDNGAQIATDGSGALYILSNTGTASVIKLSSDGKTVVWQNQLGFVASAMAVDPDGGVYVTPNNQPSDTSLYVAKLSPSGSGLAWKTSVGFLPLSTPVLAADSQSRAYVTAQEATNDFVTQTAYVVRLNSAGAAIDYTAQVMGIPTSIAVDHSGAAFLAGTETNTQGVNTGFLARVAPDGSAGYYSIFPIGRSQTVAVDANSNVVLFGSGVVQRIDCNGVIALSTKTGGNSSFALDSAGNAYVAVVTSELYPVKNSLTTCALDPSATALKYSQLFSVIAPDGSILQTTYIPGGDNLGSPLLAAGPNSTIFVAATAGLSFTPTQAGPFPPHATGDIFLTNFSPNSSAQTYPLACVGNAASFGIGVLAPGELVTLFGTGLGPQRGVQTQATAQTPYPTRSANVQVTFDGAPAPLL
jgi:hypothetical protein